MTEPNLPQQLDRMISGYWVSQAIYAAAKLGVADLLSEGPLDVEQLAAATSTHPGALYRLLRALASVDIFVEGEQRQFSLTPLAELLQSDVAGSKRSLSLMMGEDQFRAWSEIEYSIQTGKPAFDRVFGEPIFDYLKDHPEKARTFDAAMTGIHGRESDAVLDAYDFSGIGVIADIGGGNGSQISSILQQYPDMQGVLFDLPHVVERAAARIEAAGLSDRCQCVGGSFFDSIPVGAETYMLRHIIHDWDDEKSLAILRNCQQAMKPGNRLLIVESVIPPGNEPFGGKLLDLVMLLIPGGKERTEAEYHQLVELAGFELSRVVPTDTEISIVECIRQ